MQPLLHGYSTHIKGNILEIVFKPYLEQLGFFRNSPKNPPVNQEEAKQVENPNPQNDCPGKGS